MSAKQTTDTKVFEDTEQDSGCLSGPIDSLPGDSGLISDLPGDSGLISDGGESGEIKVQSPSDDKNTDEDSGLVLVTECLSSVDLSDTPVQAPAVHDKRPPAPLPPLAVLFKPDDDGDTQLHIAAENGCEKAVSILIRVCPDKEWFNVPNDFGLTALHLAAISGNPVVTRMLVIAGASVVVRDNRGETPLHKATRLSNVECIKALLNPVKEHPQRKLSTVLNQKNYNGQACVHLAAASGHIETLQTLVYYGADINSRESLAGWTALHYAAARGHAALAAHVARCAGAELRARDYAGRTPRRLARASPAPHALDRLADSSDSDTDDDDDMYDSDTEALFRKFSEDSLNPAVVA